jgi:hypothetical protein
VFTTTGGVAGKLEIGEIGARDQQNKSREAGDEPRDATTGGVLRTARE